MNRKGREVRSGAFVPLVGKCHQCVDARQNIRNYFVGGVETVLSNEFPNVVKLEAGLRMKIVRDHEPDGVRRAASLFSQRGAITSPREMGFTLPLFRSS